MDAVFEIIYPAGGGLLTDGDLEIWDDANTLTHWTKDGDGTLVREGASAYVKHGNYSCNPASAADGGHCGIYQDIANYAAYANCKLTFGGWLNAGILGAYLYISTAEGEMIASQNHPGGWAGWQRISITHTIGASPSRLRVGVMWAPESPTAYCRIDSLALILGSCACTLTINEAHVYPVDVPEGLLATGGITANGDFYYVEDGIVIIDRKLKFEAIDESLYLGLRDFYRYCVCGPTYEFDYTDRDGEEWTARMLKESLSDAKEIGPGLYNCSVNLRLKDRGI